MRVLDRKDYRLLTRDCIDKVDNRLSNRLTDCRTLAPFMKTLKFAVARRFRESVKKSKRVRGATQGTAATAERASNRRSFQMACEDQRGA